MFDGGRPTNRFRFNSPLHIAQSRRQVEHPNFLAGSGDDPRSGFMRQIKLAVEPTGSILVGNAPDFR